MHIYIYVRNSAYALVWYRGVGAYKHVSGPTMFIHDGWGGC